MRNIAKLFRIAGVSDLNKTTRSLITLPPLYSKQTLYLVVAFAFFAPRHLVSNEMNFDTRVYIQSVFSVYFNYVSVLCIHIIL